MSSTDVNCGEGGGAYTYTNLRIASIFVIFATSAIGSFFPVLARKCKWLKVPNAVFEIATAFIHLLSPALGELGSPCLSPAWQAYPYPLALAMLSLFGIFIVQLISFRWGMAKLAKLGIRPDTANSPDGASDGEKITSDVEEARPGQFDDSAMAQVVGIFILEFGILLHSLLIGLTLAVDPDFIVLFVVIVFHQMFEGLGVGSRLAFLRLPPKYNFISFVAALLYSISTPVGIIAGLGIRTTYNPNGTTASIVSGVLDSLSAGILLYTGMVELMAHEFLFSNEMNKASNGKLAYALCCMLLGTGLMALLGEWA
ncbi:ZIP-like iron-zinc transporter [Boletus edulis]|nr:ZIP-like iron-zinc transporter [Boletus edulis]